MLVPRPESAFFRDPWGGYVHGERWLYFAHDPKLVGIALWGSPSPDDARAMVGVLVRELARPRHAALVDASGLLEIAAASFEHLARYFREHEAALARVVSEGAIVLPTGMNRATVGGFFSAAPQPFPCTLFEDATEALAHLGCKDAAALAESLARAVASLQGGALARCRELLRSGAIPASLAECAKALGMAPRSLQRELGAAGSSYSLEVRRARLARAEALLVQTDAPVGTIAHDVGYASAQHMSTAFQKEHGLSPTDFRRTRK